MWFRLRYNKKWISRASEKKLYKAADKLEKKMKKLEARHYCSRKYNKIYQIHVEIVQETWSRFPLNLPKREHGWYLPNDD